MFKRKKGYLLLTLLVLTGLAGRTHSDTLTAKERHALITALKSSRQSLHQYGVAAEQAPTKRQKKAVQKKLYQTAGTTLALWEQTKAYMRVRLLRNDTSTSTLTPVTLTKADSKKNPHKYSFTNPEEALKASDQAYAEIIKYIRTTTENPKRYMVPVDGDTVNVYDVIRVIAAGENEKVRIKN